MNEMPENNDFNRCYRCFRPRRSCLCQWCAPIETNVKYVFLLHPKEAFRQKTGTGRLTALSLKNSELLIGVDFTHNERLNELINEGKRYFPVLLFPDKNAFFTDDPKLPLALGDKTLLVIVVDATWFFARKIITLSKNLHALPKLSFRKAYRSQFTFKRQPAPECLSTIESVYYLTEELKAAGIANREADVTPLMAVFRRMVGFQLESEQARLEHEAALAYPELFDDKA
jgi:DTW domain-containing protein YfiP